MTQRKRKSNNTNNSRQAVIAIVVTLVLVAAWWIASHGDQISKAFASEKVSTTTTVKRDATDIDRLMEVVAPDGLTQQIVDYEGYTSSFNADLRIPNYVVYELTDTETEGTEPRADGFMQDESVKGCPTTNDYRGSGYDRGHMAPAGDMKWSKKAMQQSFYLTNICPQNHSLNSGGWKRLEEKVRTWAARDGSLIVVTGPIIEGNEKRLDSGVAVPTGFFKVLLAPNANPMRAIGFIYKNEGGQKKVELQAVSVDDVEAVTGLDFFSSLPDETETKIEKTCDFYEWNN